MKLIKIMDGNAIEDGVWVQLNSPGTSEPLFRDAEKTLPCRVKVRSDKSKVFRSETFKDQQALQNAQARMKAKDREQLLRDAYAKQRPRWFSILLVATENCDAEKAGIVTPTQDELLEIAAESENLWIVDQVLAIGLDDANFGVAEGNDEGADRKAPGSKSK